MTRVTARLFTVVLTMTSVCAGCSVDDRGVADAGAKVHLDDGLAKDGRLYHRLDWTSDVGASASSTDGLEALRITKYVCVRPKDAIEVIAETTSSLSTEWILARPAPHIVSLETSSQPDPIHFAVYSKTHRWLFKANSNGSGALVFTSHLVQSEVAPLAKLALVAIDVAPDCAPGYTLDGVVSVRI